MSYSKLIIVIAIAMMTSSALISYTIVKRHDPLISSLKMDVQDKQSRIRDIWNDISKKENRANAAILISVFASKENKEADKIRERFLVEFPDLKSDASAADIFSAVDRDKAGDIDTINNLYLEQVSLQNNIISMEASDKKISDIAFFLQLLSLVLIIIRKDVLT